MQVAAEEELGRVYDVKLLKWVWSYVRSYQHLFWLSVLLMSLNTLFALAQPYIFKISIDVFLTAHRSTPPAWLKSLQTVWPGHGLMLMGASYLYYRYRGSLLPAAPAQEQP